MIYITQLIFLQEGKEEVFHDFEDRVLPLMERHQGILLYRIRPSIDSYIVAAGERPYEIHFVRFPSEDDLKGYLNDKARLAFVHLKEESVASILMVKGNQM